MKIKLLVFFAVLGFLPQKSHSQYKRILSLEVSAGNNVRFNYNEKGYMESPYSEKGSHMQSFFNFKTGFGKNWLFNTGMGFNIIDGYFDHARAGDTTSFHYTRSDMCLKIGVDYRIIGTDENVFNLYGGLKILWLTRLGYSLNYPLNYYYLDDPTPWVALGGQPNISAFLRFNERAGMHISLTYLLVPDFFTIGSVDFDLSYSSLAGVVGIDYYLE